MSLDEVLHVDVIPIGNLLDQVKFLLNQFPLVLIDKVWILANDFNDIRCFHIMELLQVVKESVERTHSTGKDSSTDFTL